MLQELVAALFRLLGPAHLVPALGQDEELGEFLESLIVEQFQQARHLGPRVQHRRQRLVPLVQSHVDTGDGRELVRAVDGARGPDVLERLHAEEGFGPVAQLGVGHAENSRDLDQF